MPQRFSLHCLSNTTFDNISHIFLTILRLIARDQIRVVQPKVLRILISG